jgi:hypothetical protein
MGSGWLSRALIDISPLAGGAEKGPSLFSLPGVAVTSRRLCASSMKRRTVVPLLDFEFSMARQPSKLPQGPSRDGVLRLGRAFPCLEHSVRFSRPGLNRHRLSYGATVARDFAGYVRPPELSTLSSPPVTRSGPARIRTRCVGIPRFAIASARKPESRCTRPAWNPICLPISRRILSVQPSR